MTQNITLEANGEFPFTFYIEKAIASVGTEKDMVLEGVASTTNVDHDNERMSKEALEAMANIINERGVPLRVEHSKSENAVIGKVTSAHVDERNQLHIKAVLDKNHPVSPILHHSMKDLGKKMGFSVGGLVRRAVREFAESAGRLVKTFYDVELKEVSVTPRPANYDAWAISKSIAVDSEEAEQTRDMFYDEFLFSNPQLDYLQVFAKSVPEEAWRKVASTITKNETDMTTTETETKTKASSSTETETEKAVTRKEFKVLSKGIETLAEAVKAIVNKISDGTALDQRNPDDKKPDDESGTAKAMDETALDQRNPDKKKPDDESSTAKASSDETDETDETTKTSAEGTDTEGTREEKASTRDESDYDLETVTRSIKTIQRITKEMSDTDTETKTKASSTDDETTTKTGTEETDTTDKASSDETDETTKTDSDETETTKGMHPLDKFVLTVTKALEAMHTKLEKSGKTVLGFDKSIADSIQNDSKLQKEISEMLKIPGFKKSVSFGVPYMVTKEGRRYALKANEVGEPTIQKSRDAKSGKETFKTLYKENYASIREEQ